MRFELSDCEWTANKAMLPNKPRGVQRVNDRRVLNGVSWVLRSGRRIATRYDKLAANYLAFIKLAAIRIWLRAYESAP